MTTKLDARWSQLEGMGGKTSLVNRSEQYALWSLPAVFPEEHVESLELSGEYESVGARAVNHLSNKYVTTLFPAGHTFFRLEANSAVLDQFTQAEQAGDPQAKEMLLALEEALADAERDTITELDASGYRVTANRVAKLLIVTGNACEYNDGDVTKVYSLRNFSVRRDISGNLIEIMTRETKAFSTFGKEVQDQLTVNSNQYEDDTSVTIYTQVSRKADGMYHVKQAADTVELDSAGMWKPEDLPWNVLTWERSDDEDYGRGLVEDYANAFHAMYTLSRALIEGLAAAADLKYLVDPSSILDVEKMNNSPTGSYHAGREGDVTVAGGVAKKATEWQFMQAAIERYERQISLAFLLNSAATRDAERVTAEEIRQQVFELENAHGGQYSRYVNEWQLPVAKRLLKMIDFDTGEAIQPRIITGMDSLSRQGDLVRLRNMMQDLSLIQAMPEQVLQALNISGFVSVLGTAHGVDWKRLLKSQAQMQAEQAQALQLQADQQQQQVEGQIQVEQSKQQR